MHGIGDFHCILHDHVYSITRTSIAKGKNVRWNPLESNQFRSAMKLAGPIGTHDAPTKSGDVLYPPVSKHKRCLSRICNRLNVGNGSSD
jgi:hypothetical protein